MMVSWINLLTPAPDVPPDADVVEDEFDFINLAQQHSNMTLASLVMHNIAHGRREVRRSKKFLLTHGPVGAFCSAVGAAVLLFLSTGSGRVDYFLPFVLCTAYSMIWVFYSTNYAAASRALRVYEYIQAHFIDATMCT